MIGDGVPRFAVERIDGDDVVARAVSPGPLSPRKGINVTYARPELPAITEKDVADLGLAVELGADFIALSFVRSAADIEQLRELAVAHGSAARLIAKVEKIEAYEALDEIIAASDGLMVARGDYGVEAGVARVPLMQKDTIRRATQAGKFVITATQMLESMIQAPEPTRAEATDVANAVIDGTSAVMLSAETSVGAYPVEAVQAMAEIAQAAEESPVILGRAEADAAVADQRRRHARRGRAGRAAGRRGAVDPDRRPAAGADLREVPQARPIIALAHQAGIADQLTLEWGVYPTTMATAETVDEMIDIALDHARDFAGPAAGARVVLTAGRRTGHAGRHEPRDQAVRPELLQALADRRAADLELARELGLGRQAVAALQRAVADRVRQALGDHVRDALSGHRVQDESVRRLVAGSGPRAPTDLSSCGAR